MISLIKRLIARIKTYFIVRRLTQQVMNDLAQRHAEKMAQKMYDLLFYGDKQ